MLQKTLRNADAVTHVPTLSGYDTCPEDLIHIPAEAWLETFTQAYERLVAEYDTIHIAEMYMGALLAPVLVHRARHGVARSQNRLAPLTTPVHIDGWSTPWCRDLHYAVCRIPGMAVHTRVKEDKPFDIKNPLLRRIIRAKLARGDSSYYPWVSLVRTRRMD